MRLFERLEFNLSTESCSLSKTEVNNFFNNQKNSRNLSRKNKNRNRKDNLSISANRQRFFNGR